VYRNDAEVSPTSPQLNVAAAGAGDARQSVHSAAAAAAAADPFYERFPWFRLLGRSARHR